MHCCTTQPEHREAYGPDSGHHENLAEHHLHELHVGSGIPLEVVAERDYRTVGDPAELRRLGFADYQCRPGLLIPLHDTTGGNGRFALKPDRPRVEQRPGKPDRPIKYEGQAAQPLVLDVPVRCLPSLLDATVDLWITEGWKKGDALAGAVKCVIALGGVWNWCHTDENGNSGTPLPDWDPIVPTLDGRRAFVCFDSDAATNPNVRLAERRLVNFLHRHGAWVTIVRLPSAPDGSKMGADDYLVAHGSAALDELAVAAELAGSDDVQTLRTQLAAKDAELQYMRDVLTKDFAVLKNRNMTPGEKIAFLVTAHEIGWHLQKGQPGPYKVVYDGPGGLAEGAGMSAQSVSAAIQKFSCEGRGLFTRRVTLKTNEKGEPRKQTELAPVHASNTLELLRVGATWAPKPDRKTWGGKRPHKPELEPVVIMPRCPDHPTADVHHSCTVCGQVIEEQLVPSQPGTPDPTPPRNSQDDSFETPVSLSPLPITPIGQDDHFAARPSHRRLPILPRVRPRGLLSVAEDQSHSPSVVPWRAGPAVAAPRLCRTCCVNPRLPDGDGRCMACVARAPAPVEVSG